MTSDRVPAERREDALAFDPRSPSPLVRRGLLHLAERAADLTPVAAPFSLLWQYGAEMATHSLGYLAQAEVNGNLVHVPTVSDWVALDGLTGTERWRAGFAPSHWRVGDNLVLHGLGEDLGSDILCAFDVTTGQRRWCFKPDAGDWVWPALVDGSQRTVYAMVSTDLVALDAATGSERWRIETVEETAADDVIRVYKDLALIWNTEGQIVALTAATGVEQWRTAGSYELPGAVIDDGVIWAAGGFPGHVVAVDLETGLERWRVAGPTPRDSLRLMGVVEDTAYVASKRYSAPDPRPTVYALDALTGLVRWQREIEDEQVNVYGVPYVGAGEQLASSEASEAWSLSAGAVYEGGADYLCALDAATGAERWRFRLDERAEYDRVYPSVGAVGVYIIANGRLLALHPGTGELRWMFERSVGDFRLGCRVCQESATVVYVASANNALYALDVRTGLERDRFEFSAPPSAAELFEPILQWVSGGSAWEAKYDAGILRKYAMTAQAASVLGSVERRLDPYGYSLPDEHRVKELTAIGALLDLLRSPSDLIGPRVTTASEELHLRVCSVLGAPAVQIVNDTLYVTTPESVYALKVSG